MANNQSAPAQNYPRVGTAVTGDVLLGVRANNQLALFDAASTDAYTTTGLAGRPSSTDLNNLGTGVYTFIIDATTLDLPPGRYFIRSYQARDGSKIIQEAVRTEGTPTKYTRTRFTGDWTDTDVFTVDATGGGGGGGGLTQEQVDERVQAGVQDWAEAGDTSQIPANKLGNAPSGGLNEAGVRQLIFDWAEEGNTSRIPENKISTEIARTSAITGCEPIQNYRRRWNKQFAMRVADWAKCRQY